MKAIGIVLCFVPIKANKINAVTNPLINGIKSNDFTKNFLLFSVIIKVKQLNKSPIKGV